MTIRTNADGTEVWAEAEPSKMISEMDIEVLKMTARQMGARVTDPTGAAEFTIRDHAAGERSRIENWLGREGYESVLSDDTRQRWYREEMQKTEQYMKDDLREIGK
jgi:hypothetical protein